jgi:YidC/Oxa1 family membrane protein insertase
MVLLLPLTLKSTKSMLEMQKIQPLVKKIQQEYKNDLQGRNEATMALYKEHKVNPASGCLPLLLQAPFFTTMWRVLYGLTVRCGERGQQACDPGAAKTFFPKYLSHDAELYKALLGKTEMKSFGLDFSRSAFRVIQDNVVKGLPYLALVILVGLLGYYQQRQTMSRTAGQEVPSQQQLLMKVMPILFGFISLILNSGIIVYNLVQNVFRILQNVYITKRFYSEPETLVSTMISKPIPASIKNSSEITSQLKPDRTISTKKEIVSKSRTKKSPPPKGNRPLPKKGS